ncbi:Nin1 binding protein, partial [Irineochytrium annulatum]
MLVVVDANALIKSQNLESIPNVTDFYTVPEVLSEIRDKRSLEFLQSKNYVLQTKIPSQECLRDVMSFAKKTGDYAALSLTDMK